MNHLSPRCFIFTVSLLLAGPAAVGAPVDRFVRTQEHIDALLKRRLKPEPLPADLPNPFLITGGVRLPDGTEPEPSDGSAGAAHPVTPPPGSDTEVLALYAAKLKISGTVLLNGRVHLIINQSPYKEGDFLPLDNKSTPLYLQIIRITPDELTLGLNQAVQTIKLKGL